MKSLSPTEDNRKELEAVRSMSKDVLDLKLDSFMGEKTRHILKTIKSIILTPFVLDISKQVRMFATLKVHFITTRRKSLPLHCVARAFLCT